MVARPPAHRPGAEIAARRGDANGAIELLKRVAALHPDDLDIAFELARRRLLMMRQREAAMSYIDALMAQVATLDPPRKINLAHLLKEAGRRDEAITIGFAARLPPIGFAAGMLGVGVPDVMAGAATSELGPLAVEWFNSEGQEASRGPHELRRRSCSRARRLRRCASSTFSRAWAPTSRCSRRTRSF